MNLQQRILARLGLALDRRSVDASSVSLEDIVAWQEGSLSEKDARAVEHYVANSERGFALWSGLVGLEASAATAVRAARPRPRWWSFAVPALALGVLAAVLLPTLLGPGDPDSTQVADGALSIYSLTVQGGLTARGGESLVALRDGAALEIVLVPASTSDLETRVAVFAQTSAGIVPVDVPIAREPGGVVVVDGVLGEDIDVPRGVERLLVVLSLPGQAPDMDGIEILDSATEAQGDGWRLWVIDVAS